MSLAKFQLLVFDLLALLELRQIENFRSQVIKFLRLILIVVLKLLNVYFREFYNCSGYYNTILKLSKVRFFSIKVLSK